MLRGGAEAVMLVLGSSCLYSLTLVDRFDCIETTMNHLLVNSYQNLSVKKKEIRKKEKKKERQSVSGK